MTERSESERAELVALAQAFLDRKYVTRADSRQKEMGLAYIEAERQDLAQEVARFCASEIDRRLAAQDQKPVAWRWKSDGVYQYADCGFPVSGAEQLFTTPPSADGWNEAIETVDSEIGGGLDVNRWIKIWESNGRKIDEAVAVGFYHQALQDVRSALEALRHNAPPDSGAENYRDAIDEALVTRFIGVAKGDARAELNQIIKWEVAVALDPRVSSSAQALIDSGRNASAEARLREVLEFYAREWQTNMEGDSETPGLSRCWREPTDNLLHDEGVRAREALSAHPHASDCDKQGEAKCPECGGSGSIEIDDDHFIECKCAPSDRTADVTEDQMARAWKSEQNRYEILIFGGNRPCQVTCDGSLAFTGAGEDCETFIRTRCARTLLDAFAVRRR